MGRSLDDIFEEYDKTSADSFVSAFHCDPDPRKYKLIYSLLAGEGLSAGIQDFVESPYGLEASRMFMIYETELQPINCIGSLPNGMRLIITGCTYEQDF